MNFTSNYVFKICWIFSIVVGQVTSRRRSENWSRFRIHVIVFNRTDMLYYYPLCGDVGTVRVHVAGQRFNYNFFVHFSTFGLCNWCSFVSVFLCHCLCRFSYLWIGCWLNTLIIIVEVAVVVVVVVVVVVAVFFFCGAATQRGSWPPHSWGF